MERALTPDVGSERAAPTRVESALARLAEAGAATTVHPSGTLMAHLRGTYDCLARWGCPEHLCLAGLYHSVYGTEAFRTATIRSTERALVRARIGEGAERLVHLYATIVRRTLYENLSRGAPYTVVDRLTGEERPLDGAQELADLMTLDLANRIEQLPRTSMSLRRMEADRRIYERAVPLLPRAAIGALRRTYRPRSRVLIVADGIARRMARLIGRLRRHDHAG
jgi:uncharacterized protein DUF6817